MLLVVFQKLATGQHGINTLNGGNDHGSALVEARAPELLDVVEFCERAACPRRAVGEEFVAGLSHQVGAVSQKENALELGVFEQPMAERAGGEGLAGAGCHLNERARLVGSQ